MANSDPQLVSESHVDVDRQLRRITRRSFATGSIAALIGTASLWWLKSAKLDDGISWPLRKVLQFNERVSQAYFGPSRLAPTFDVSLAKEPRVNGKLGLKNNVDVARWRLDVLSPGEKPVVERSLPINAIHELPRFEMVTEFKCVEGWSQIVQWAGARLSDFIEKYGHETPFIGLTTPDREYYVGLDRASAMHSQSLNRNHVPGVDCLHEISEIQQARLEFVLMPNAHVAFVRLEWAVRLEGHVLIERLDGLHDHGLDKFVADQYEASVREPPGQFVRRQVVNRFHHVWLPIASA